ncbi:hypothetical protein V8625_004339 [Salmonella enterica subsp. enterica serovar Bareilly]
MYKISILTALLLISVSSGVVQAERKFTIGAGVGVVEHPYKDYDNLYVLNAYFHTDIPRSEGRGLRNIGK